MSIYLRRLAVFAVVLVMVFALTACADTPVIDIPPLPTYSDETPTPIPSPTLTPTPVPSVVPSRAPIVYSTPSPAVADPSPVPTVETDVPIITISKQTLPKDMVQYNVATLHGIVSTDKGSIIRVTAQLLDGEGNMVQECYYQPYQVNFSLAGTVNAELRFAELLPGDYTYTLSAEAEHNGITVRKELIYQDFTVYATQNELNISAGSSDAVYTAKISQEDSNAAAIWNFLIVYLDNPYGAAGVLANIDVESGCDPKRVQGDFSEGFSYSYDYTRLVDEGNVNRDSFIWALPGEAYGSGYGLCQWTLDRKEGLYDLAQDQGTSIGDLNTQCTYLIMELEMKYPELSKLLRTTDDAREAAREFFYVYEQGSEMGARPGIAEEYLNRFAS